MKHKQYLLLTDALDRRNFLKKMGLFSAGVALYPFINGCSNSSSGSSADTNQPLGTTPLNLNETLNFVMNSYGLKQETLSQSPEFYIFETTDNGTNKVAKFNNLDNIKVYSGFSQNTQAKVLVVDSSIKPDVYGIERTTDLQPNPTDYGKGELNQLSTINNSQILKTITQGNSESQLEAMLNEINNGIHEMGCSNFFNLFEAPGQGFHSGNATNGLHLRQDYLLGTHNQNINLIIPTGQSPPTQVDIYNLDGTKTNQSFNLTYNTDSKVLSIPNLTESTTLANGSYELKIATSTAGIITAGIVRKGVLSSKVPVFENSRADENIVGSNIYDGQA